MVTGGVGLVEAGALPGRTKLDNLLGWDVAVERFPAPPLRLLNDSPRRCGFLTAVRRAVSPAGPGRGPR
ncbi:MAG: hypothetical protein ACR2M5_01935 [Nakamurella sp.]